MKNKIYSKNFLKSLLYRQNDYHRYGVFRHTMMVVYHLIRMKQYKMIIAGFLHDIGKPFVAYPDEKDISRARGELSFTHHEEYSYILIKNSSFISTYTKQLVRYHYIIRALGKAKEKKEESKHRRLKRRWDSLNDTLKKDLGLFLQADDLAKK